MKQHTIHLHPLGKKLIVNDQTPLIDVLHEFGVEFPCGGKGTCGKCKVKLLKGEIETNGKHEKMLKKLELSDDWRLACLSSCTSNLTLEVEQFSHMILADETDFEFTPIDGFGIAVDLGTTTVVAQLIDLKTAEVLSVETMLNPQVKYGADLISRIQACIDGKSEEMEKAIRRAIGNMITSLLQKKQVCLNKIVIVGNTAMQLIFSGEDVSPLANYPFHVENIGMKAFQPEELGWNIACSGKVEFIPSIASFVGSDILAGIAATGLSNKQPYTALIDLGTNGEIVLGNKDHIVCASTAAGPAFEGANISMGMRAVTGAISSLSEANGAFEAHVIGNVPAKGICGSALIDAIALLGKTGQIGMFGEINSGEQVVPIFDKVSLNQKDINEFQLAKAALAAGLTILANKLDISLDAIEEVYIAGGFGNYINLEHTTMTGMIEVHPDKIHKMGNTALIGAKMFLYKKEEYLNEILAKTTHINLEGDPNFQDIYVDRMMFNVS